MDPMNSLAGRTRRTFLRQGLGLGAIALASMESAGAQEQRPAAGPLSPKAPPRPAKAKRVLYLSMSGAPPQHDMFDPKPRLNELDGTPAPTAFFEGKRLAFIKGHPKLLGSPHASERYGECGMEGSVLTPSFGRYADRITLVRSMPC